VTSRVVTTDAEFDGLLRLLAAQKRPFTISIAKGKKRSVEQNRLQRLWMNEIAEQLGDRTPEDARAYCKLHIGVPILREENADFREAYDRLIRDRLSYEEKLEAMAVPLDFPVTRLMSTEQKKRYLDEIVRRFSEAGVVLTDPDARGRYAREVAA
jgi:hypothetical protein